MSFLEFKPFLGITGSPWVGWDNYKNIFQMPMFRDALFNTLSYKSLYILIGGLLAFVTALALGGIQSGRLRGWISSVLVLPYVIPSAVLAHFVMLMFSASEPTFETTERLFLAEAGSFRFILLGAELLKYGAIPVIVALAAIAAAQSRLADSSSGASFWKMNALPAARAVAALMLLQLAMILTTDFELLHMLINPMVLQSAGTVDHFIFQTGLLQGHYSPSIAASMVAYALQFVLAVAAYFIVRGTLLDSLFSNHTDYNANLKGGSRIAGAAVGIAGVGIVLAVLYYIVVDPFLRPSAADVKITELLSLPRAALAIVLYGIATLINMLVTLLLAYPMTARRLPGGILYRIMLIAAAGIGTGTIYEYMYFRSLGMVNTFLPLFIIGLIHIVPAFLLKSLFNGKYGHLKEQAELEGRGELISFFTLFIPKIWKPLLALGALQFIVLWNSYLPSIIYIADPSKHLGMMQFVSAMNTSEAFGVERGDPILYRVGAILTLPPVVLFLLLRKWIVSEILIGGLFRRN